MKFLLTYKFSQDHIELFFGKIRSFGGCNNNPTARQFAAAFKKILTHNDLSEVLRGNVTPLETVPLLSVSSVKKDVAVTSLGKKLIHQLNDATSEHRVLIEEINEEIDFDLNFDDDVNIENAFASNIVYYRNVITYVAGFVVKRIGESLSCDQCCSALYQAQSSLDSENLKFIQFKSKGFLINPSNDVVSICISAEQHYQADIKQSFKINVLKLVSIVSSAFIGKSLFENLNDHALSGDLSANHVCLLIKCIAATYLECRMHHAAKEHTYNLAFSKNIKSRQISNHLLHFNGL